MLEITDYDVPELNTSGMEETSVGTLLPIPSADVQVWTRGLEPTNGGTVFPSEVLPTAYTTGRVMRVIPPRLSPSATEDVPITSVEDRADLHAPCCSGGGIAAALVGMSPIMLGSLAADAFPLQLNETKLKVLWTGIPEGPDKVDVGSLIITMVIDVHMDLLTIWDYYGVLPVYSGQLTTGEYAYGTHPDIPGKKRPLAGGDWPGEPRPRT